MNSDKSQPIKIVLLAIGLLIVASGFWVISSRLEKLEAQRPLAGITQQSYNYQQSDVTNTSVACSGATSTAIVGTQGARTSMTFARATGTIITICKAETGCISGSSG